MNPIPQSNEPQRQPNAPPALSNRPAPVPHLPPASSAPAPQPTPAAVPAGNGKGWRMGLLAAAAAAAVAVGLQLFSTSATESNHANWPQVREASAHPSGEVRWQGTDGAVMFLTALPFSDADRDVQTTAAVRAALEAGDDAKAEQIIAAAQVNAPTPPPFIPPPAPGSSVVASPAAPAAPTTPLPAPAVAPAPQPTLTPGMKAEIRRGDTEFFHLYLYDCCDEDGDVVDVLLNGQLFQTVKLTNRGATISIPVSVGGATKIQLRGVYDGGGGITVGCRSSRGHGFLRAMAVGDVELLGTVRK